MVGCVGDPFHKDLDIEKIQKKYFKFGEKIGTLLGMMMQLVISG